MNTANITTMEAVSARPETEVAEVAWLPLLRPAHRIRKRRAARHESTRQTVLMRRRPAERNVSRSKQDA